MKRNYVAFFGFLWVAILFWSAGCALSPEEKKAQHIQRGNEYMAEEKYKEAIIEFRNVLKIDGGDLKAIENIGIAHFELGEIQKAYQFLSKARELGTQNADVSVKLSAIYLLARKPEEARQEAEFALQKEPGNVDALLLYTAMPKDQNELEEFIRTMEERKQDLKGCAGLSAGPRQSLSSNKQFGRGEKSIPGSLEY